MNLKLASEEEGFPNWPLLSRALSNHDPNAAYTLLAERYSPPFAGRALVELIRTVPDWPKSGGINNFDMNQLLTHRELQVLRCAERGLSVLETAKELIIGLQTVKRHRQHIIYKLESKNMLEAIHRGRELRIIG